MHFHSKKYIHIAFALILITALILIIYRLSHFGTKVDLTALSTQPVDASESSEYHESYDNIMPLTDKDGYLVSQEINNILILGNDYFSTTHSYTDSLTNLLSQNTGANVIDLSVSGSYMAAERYAFDDTAAPMDVFCPYWMATQMVKHVIDAYYINAFAALGDALPPEASTVYETLNTIDLAEVDIVVFAYDLTDFKMYHSLRNHANESDVQSYTGNLTATYELLHEAYPQIRFVVMGPYYNFFRDAAGNITDADLLRNGYGSPASYALEAYSVAADNLDISYVDNYYSSITASNCEQYLQDDSQLNANGRELLARRLAEIILYYSPK